MKKLLCVLALAFSSTCVMAQFALESDTSWKKIFRGSNARINNVVHTKLDVRFDFDKSYLYGKEWLTLQPHFYPTDSVLLDAKGMDIKVLSIIKGTVKTPLKFTYNGLELNVKLDRVYTAKEKYTLYIEYVSKPNELETTGSVAIAGAKGLYFIDPKGTEPNKPTQIWTQGETESNSAWMVTIDKPNQKTTQELSMTVPSKFVTLSNGSMISQKKNADGTRTDTWKMELPHAPYLFFMGVGDFAVIKETYKGKEVSYYVDHEYAPYAKGIFGNTPEMMAFFSKLLGVEYPWSKYAQMVATDYVSGAMENTTATLHGEMAYQDNRQLADGNVWEETIAHELFHHWFGDLVTAESWTQITVNESFANYSEYLWDDYKYSRDKADQHHFNDMQGYLNSGSEQKDLVRFHYANNDDVFDAVSYNKGGRILHMLRNHVGDSAFFKSLNVYLNNNKFKAGEAAQVRLAFEEVSGKDLSWFFNQWYYGSGHPKLKIDYLYNDAAKTASVIVEQTQKTGKVFTLPVAVDIYTGENKVRHNVWVKNRIDTLVFSYTSKPDLINFDGDKILLAEKTDNKSEENAIAQWKYGKLFLDRKEAIDFFAKKNMPEIAKGLYDKYYGIRQITLQKLAATPYKSDPVVLARIEEIAKSDLHKPTRAAALKYLLKLGDKKHEPLFRNNLNDSSYSVSGAALEGLAAFDKEHAYTMAKQNIKGARGALSEVAADILLTNGVESDFELIASAYRKAPASEKKVMMTDKYGEYLAKLTDINKIKTGIDDMISFRNKIPAQYHMYVDPAFKKSFDVIIKAKGTEIENYINQVFK